MSLDVEACIQEIRDLAVADGLAARLTLASLAQTLVSPVGTQLVVVGGTAVDTYVSGTFGTSEELPAGWEESRDIDTIALYPLGSSARQASVERLVEAGFEVIGAGGALRHPQVPFAIDLVGDRLDPDISRDHLVRIEREPWEGQGLEPVILVGPEDLLFDYLESGVDTRHQRDWARALAMASVMEEHLDLGYLYGKAHWRLDGRFVDWLDKLLAGEPLDVA